jgi:hypothetical protein
MFLRRVLIAQVGCCIAALSLTAAQPRPAIDVDVKARAIQPGELVVLTVTTRTPVVEVRVRAFDGDLPSFQITPTRWRVIVGIDLDTPPGRHDVTIVAATTPPSELTHRLTVMPKKFRTRQLTVDPSFVDPPPDTLVRIKEEAERINRVWASSIVVPLWSGPFVRPVPEASNSAFGSRSVYNGQSRSPHGGADFASPAGTPVRSANAGRVALAGDLYFTGNTVIVDHGGGLFSFFAHLRSIAVRESDLVTTGALIGEVGATGRVTGPHLHWAVRANNARVDPISLLAVLGD